MLSRRLLLYTLIFFMMPKIFCFSFQFTSEEIEQRAKWEEYLKTADIFRSEDIGEGVTNPTRLFLRKGTLETSGTWKNPSGVQKGFLEGWQYEIAAYRMDKLLGLNMIPTTVERTFLGKRGSLQLWVDFRMNEMQRKNRGFSIPSEKKESRDKLIYLARAFDSLIANTDRADQNKQYTEDWRLILIDHSRSFRSQDRFTVQLIYGKRGIKRRMPFSQLPRAFVESVRNLDFDTIKKTVGSYLTDKEIKALLIRKNLLLREIDEMIKERGEVEVLY